MNNEQGAKRQSARLSFSANDVTSGESLSLPGPWSPHLCTGSGTSVPGQGDGEEDVFLVLETLPCSAPPYPAWLGPSRPA